jgi:hypothetical protein
MPLFFQIQPILRYFGVFIVYVEFSRICRFLGGLHRVGLARPEVAVATQGTKIKLPPYEQRAPKGGSALGGPTRCRAECLMH